MVCRRAVKESVQNGMQNGSAEQFCKIVLQNGSAKWFCKIVLQNGSAGWYAEGP